MYYVGLPGRRRCLGRRTLALEQLLAHSCPIQLNEILGASCDGHLLWEAGFAPEFREGIVGTHSVEVTNTRHVSQVPGSGC